MRYNSSFIFIKHILTMVENIIHKRPWSEYKLIYAWIGNIYTIIKNGNLLIVQLQYTYVI